MAEITVESLLLDQLHMVYPLVREVVRRIELREWLRFARDIASPRHAGRSGIVVARRVGQRFPCGLFCYRTEPDLQHGMVLVADYFVALDILDAKPIAEVLVSELAAVARRCGCEAIRSVLRNGSDDISAGLLSAGYRPESETLRFEARIQICRWAGPICPGAIN